MKVPLNKAAYSPDSKRSIGFENLGDEYADKHFNCYRCSEQTVFWAVEQKQAFEVRKEYMWAQRRLCQKCWVQMRSMKALLADMESAYCKDKSTALNDRVFLQRWLQVLEHQQHYISKPNTSRIVFIKKALLKI